MKIFDFDKNLVFNANSIMEDKISVPTSFKLLRCLCAGSLLAVNTLDRRPLFDDFERDL